MRFGSYAVVTHAPEDQPRGLEGGPRGGGQVGGQDEAHGREGRGGVEAARLAAGSQPELAAHRAHHMLRLQTLQYLLLFRKSYQVAGVWTKWCLVWTDLPMS